jgi:hypothetical protein
MRFKCLQLVEIISSCCWQIRTLARTRQTIYFGFVREYKNQTNSQRTWLKTTGSYTANLVGNSHRVPEALPSPLNLNLQLTVLDLLVNSSTNSLPLWVIAWPQEDVSDMLLFAFHNHCSWESQGSGWLSGHKLSYDPYCCDHIVHKFDLRFISNLLVSTRYHPGLDSHGHNYFVITLCCLDEIS